MTHETDSSSAPGLPTVRAFALLAVAYAITLGCVGTYGNSTHGSAGILAAVVACGVCGLGSAVALACVMIFRQPQFVVQAVGFGMLFRMALALGGGILLTTAGGPLAEAGVFGMIVAFYLVGLVVETALAVRLLGGSWQGMSKV